MSRQGNAKRSPPAHLAVDRDRTAMCVDDTLDNREAEADAAPLLAGRLPEAVEDVRDLLAGDTRSGVAHGEHDLAGRCARSDEDRAFFWCELDRVPEQVREDLRESMTVRFDRSEIGD